MSEQLDAKTAASPPEIWLSGEEAEAALKAAGFPYTKRTLLTYHTRPPDGGPPPYEIRAGRAMYPRDGLLEWAERHSSKPRAAAAAASARWREVHNRRRAELRAAGMHPDHAAVGAWWHTHAAFRAEHGCDDYDAEVGLRALGIKPPDGDEQRWARLKPGDAFNPGDRGRVRARVPAPPPPEPPRRTPYEAISQLRTADKIAVLTAWRKCHGGAAVAPADVAPEVRRLLAGAAADEWTDADLAHVLDKVFVGIAEPDGKIFQAIDRPAAGWAPRAFALTYPPLPPRAVPRDEALRPIVAEIDRRVTELRDDPAFMPGAELGERIAAADRLAFDEAVRRLTTERRCDRASAEALLRKGGVEG